MLIELKDITSRLPIVLNKDDTPRVELLIGDSLELIREQFQRAGRDFDQELVTVPWLESATKRVVREMVSAAVLIGGNAGVRSVSSTTGPQSDSITYADGIDWVSFGGVRLTTAQAQALGLRGGPYASVRSTRPIRWPERRHRG